jgi:hypothetical protein
MAGNRNSGRRPKPTSLKVLQGNAGKRPLNDAEPKPEGEVVRPAFLTAGAVAVWEKEAPVCLAMGTLTAADVRAFAAMCELCARFQANAAREEPSDAAMVNMANSLKAYFDFFGMTPSGRSRIRIPKAKEPESKWAGLIG